MSDKIDKSTIDKLLEESENLDVTALTPNSLKQVFILYLSYNIIYVFILKC
jgi:hypothetical protein